MKKFLVSFITLFLIPFFLFFIQQIIFRNMKFVTPNLILIYFIFTLCISNYKISYIASFLFGFFLDLLFSPFIGISIFAFLVTAFSLRLINFFLKNSTKINSIIKIIIGTFIFEIIRYISICFFSNVALEILSFLKIISFEIIFNTLILIVIYIPLEKIKEIIQKTYLKSNILTRYF